MMKTDAELTDALNTCADYLTQNLPPHYDCEIVVNSVSKEATVELIDPYGEKIEITGEGDNVLSEVIMLAKEDDER